MAKVLLLASPETDSTEPFMHSAENFRNTRIKAGMCQKAVAFASGMRRTTLSRLETRERAPKFRTLVELARSLDVTPASLLRGVH